MAISVSNIGQNLNFLKGGFTDVEVEPILWLRTKQIMAGIKLFSYSLNALVSTALARLPHTGDFT